MLQSPRKFLLHVVQQALVVVLDTIIKVSMSLSHVLVVILHDLGPFLMEVDRLIAAC